MENSKEKQIDEMAKVIEQARIKATDTTNSMNYGFGGWYAKELYNAGYRKASEVAREIFEEIERFLYMHFRICKEEIGNDDTEYVKGRLELNTQMQNLIAELKKKYMEEGK